MRREWAYFATSCVILLRSVWWVRAAFAKRTCEITQRTSAGFFQTYGLGAHVYRIECLDGSMQEMHLKRIKLLIVRVLSHTQPNNTDTHSVMTRRGYRSKNAL